MRLHKLDMAVERAIDPVLKRGVGHGYGYKRKLDELLDAIFALVREHDPDNETCPMCGGGLVEAKEVAAPVAGRPKGRQGWLSTSLVVGMGLGAIGGALAAAGLERYFKVRERSRSERLVDLLRAQPGRPIGELSVELYGTDTPSNRSKVRALLAQHRKLRNVGHGRWVVVGDDSPGDEEHEEENEPDM